MEDASSLAEGMNLEFSAMIEESMALLIKSSSWMVPSSSWKVVIPIWVLVRIGISLDLDMKLPEECVCCSAERLDLHETRWVKRGGEGEGKRGERGEREREREREEVAYHHGWFDGYNMILSWTAVPSDHVQHFGQQLHRTTGDKSTNYLNKQNKSRTLNPPCSFY